MNEKANYIFSGLCAIATFLFGNNPASTKFVIALAVFIAFDLITGVINALIKKEFKAGVFEYGILKKVGILVAVSFCYFIDKFQIVNVGINFESITAMFFIGGEIISNIENFANMGLKLPQQLISAINKQFIEGGEEIAK